MICGGFIGGGLTGSFSRSAVNYQAGVYTAMSNVIMAIVVMFTLLVLTPLFKYTPNCILSAIIISAVLSLIDLRAAWLIWKIDKFDFLACLGAFVGVFFVSVEIGLLIAVSSNPPSKKLRSTIQEALILHPKSISKCLAVRLTDDCSGICRCALAL